MRPELHVGVTPWTASAGGDGAALLADARRAEELGFDSLWLPESHFFEGCRPSPLLELAAVAGVTRRILLGCTSYLLTLRPPLLAAEELALLDRLSGGRLLIGLGRGFRHRTLRAFGVDPGRKREILERSLEVILAAWRGEPVAAGAEVCPRPVQTPHPPLWLAAFGPKALAQAGRLGLPYLASPMESLDRLRENAMRHREAAEAAGHDPSSWPVPVMRTAFVSDDPRRRAAVSTALESEARTLAGSGAVALRRMATEPLGERALVGDADDVLEQAARYREALGVTHLVLRPLVPGAEARWIEESVTALAECAGRLRGTEPAARYEPAAASSPPVSSGKV